VYSKKQPKSPDAKIHAFVLYHLHMQGSDSLCMETKDTVAYDLYEHYLG
jgi:hypothetical protein